MTQEEKELLLKDLCGRYPYSVKVNVNGEIQTFDSLCDDDGYRFQFLQSDGITEGVNIENIKPYLRPMSSMTEEEREELEHLSDEYFGIALDKQIEELVSSSSKEGSRVLEYIASSVVVDWLNEHHFDYRGLIEKGLALEAPEDMYNN